MKKLIYVAAMMLSTLGLGCASKSQEEPLDPSKFVCWKAIADQDTALLSIDTTGKRFRGFFELNFAGLKKMHGEIKGVIRGDTLKGNFDFKVNQINKWYRNPVAFLQKDGQLIMGVGDINVAWGSGIFNEKLPIDYQKGKFVFEIVNCPLND